MKKRSEVSRVITLFVQASALFAFIMSIRLGSWFNAVSALWAFLITFLPAIFERWNHIELPNVFTITILLFVYASLILGEFGEFYVKFPWWDNMLHSFSGFALAMSVFLTMLWLYQDPNQLGHISPGLLILLSFCFAVACGAIWEILEFTSDRLFDTDMQRWKIGEMAGLMDTMTDIIMDTIGALISSIIGYVYLKRTKLINKMRRLKFKNVQHTKSS